MTREEALAEAQKRWGKGAVVQHVPDSYNWKFRVFGGGDTEASGWGGSWEAVFDDADCRNGASKQAVSLEGK